MVDSRIPDFQECPKASCDKSGDMDVAYTMGTGMWAPETVVVRSEEGVRSGVMCLQGINCQWNSVQLPVAFGPKLLKIACSRETLWDPGGVGAFRLVVCYTCFCLIALSRCILSYDLRRSCLPNLFLKDICGERTIERELVSVGSFIPPSRVSFSSITALLRLCVNVREAASGVIACHEPGDIPMGGGGFSGHSVWLQLVSRWEWLWCHLIGVCGHTVACSCRFGILYKCRAVAERSSLDTAPMTGSLLSCHNVTVVSCSNHGGERAPDT